MVPPPSAVRMIMATPCFGVAKTAAKAALAAVVERTMTPDLAHSSVSVWVSTCAMTEKSPLADW